MLFRQSKEFLTKPTTMTLYPASDLGRNATEILENRFARLREPTKYIDSYRTGNGRHLALTRQTKLDVYVWLECAPPNIDGVCVRNSKFPGRPYSPNQPRSSNVSNASKNLGIGNEAYYVRCETLGSFERLMEWYALA
jgi:hypothetical protein